MYEKILKAAVISVPVTVIVYSTTAFARLDGYLQRTFLTEHSSNFYWGLTLMAIIQSVVSGLAPKYRKVGLALALTSNLVANLYEEINFGWGRLSQVGSRQYFTSDWLDFGSGITASAVFLGLYAAIELCTRRNSLRLNPQTQPSDGS